MLRPPSFASFLLTAAFLGLAAVPSLRAATYTAPASNRVERNFNADWLFLNGAAANANVVAFNDTSWTSVGRPHTTKFVSPEDTAAYTGVSWYRKHFTVDSAYQGRKVYLEFGAAMQVADVWINGTLAAHREGGYLRFNADATALLNYGGADNVVAVKVDSTFNVNWAPGKADGTQSGAIDFRYHGGLYRDVRLIVTDPLHVTDPVFANKVAGGGIFVTIPAATVSAATVNTKTHVFNESASSRTTTVVSTLVDAAGEIVQTASSTLAIAAGANTTFDQNLGVTAPNLWHPQTPYLYTLHTEVSDGVSTVDYQKTRVGIRRIQWTHDNGLLINGNRFKAQGSNLHQDIYGVANAVPARSIYLEVKRQKDAGFDFIRCSHYPRAPAFYDACDELGVLVMDAIPGWQNYINSTAFNNNTYKDAREMVRANRNHPSIIAWETSLNESNFSSTWAQTIHNAAHAEYPGNQFYTAGWKDTVFDIFCSASQAGVRTTTDTRPIIIDEYGDWDYGGNSSTSRVAREDTDAKLLVQCNNYQQSLNNNLALSWFSVDALWVGADYTGYLSPTHKGAPIDYYRLPKFSRYLVQSQRDAGSPAIANVESGPMVYIANTWQSAAASPTTVRVFSNCEQVSLYVNGTLFQTRTPDTNYANMRHPPFTFTLGAYTSGALRADGLISGQVVATHTRRTPGSATTLRLRAEDANTPLQADGGDARLVWVEVLDANGQVVPTATNSINLAVTGAGNLFGPSTVVLKGGQLATWVKAGRSPGTLTLTATGTGLTPHALNLTTSAVPGLAALPIPAAPTALAGSSTSGQINLTWTDNATNESSFVLERSTDNVTFTPLATLAANVTAAADAAVNAGATYYYRVRSRNTAGDSTATASVAVTVSSSVSTWTDTDIGNVGTFTGSASFAGGTYTIDGAGADIWGTADAFHHLYWNWTGDGAIVARVVDLENTNAKAKAGVMYRESTAAGSAHAMINVTATTGTEFIRRTATGGTSVSTDAPGFLAPRWLKLVRVGNAFSAYHSPDGNTWTQVGTAQTVAMNSALLVGLAVNSHNATALATAHFDNVALYAPPGAPTNLAGTAGDTQAVLIWTANPGAVSYSVKRATVSGGPYTEVASGLTATGYTQTGLTNGTTYYYIVTSVNPAAESAASTQISVQPLPPAPPSPGNLVATAGNTQVALSWSASPGATSYTITRSLIAGGFDTVVVSGLAATSHTDTGLTNGTTYYFAVTATNSGGTSDVSTQVSAVPLSAYQSWKQSYGLPIDAADNGDFDRDGLPNLVEYALLSIPSSAQSGTAQQPVLGIAPSGALTLTFRRERGDVTYTVEGSDDLFDWLPVAVNPGSVGASVTVTDTVNPPIHRYLRLRVQLSGAQ